MTSRACCVGCAVVSCAMYDIRPAASARDQLLREAPPLFGLFAQDALVSRGTSTVNGSLLLQIVSVAVESIVFSGSCEQRSDRWPPLVDCATTCALRSQLNLVVPRWPQPGLLPLLAARQNAVTGESSVEAPA